MIVPLLLDLISGRGGGGWPPRLRVEALDAVHTDEAGAEFTFRVYRTGDARAACSVAWTVTGSGDTPASAADFGGTLPSGSTLLAVGETEDVVTVTIAGGSSSEENETFTITLSDPVGAAIEQATAIGTILRAPVELDFTAGLPSGFTFARASGQMVRNASGVATWLANDAYPLHYDAAGAAEGALLERATTNNHASFASLSAALGASIPSSVQPAPNGENEADLLIEDTSTGLHRGTLTSFPVKNTSTNMFHAFVKPAGRAWVNHYYLSSNGNSYRNLTTGEVGVGSPLASWYEAWGDGWGRISLRVAHTADTTTTGNIRLATGNNLNSYAGDGSSGMLVWGLEQVDGWYPTSPVPTAGSAATRAATALSGTFAARRPATIRVKGRAPLGVRPDADQFVCALTGETEADLIEIYRDYTDRHVMAYYGSTSIDLGEVLDGTTFDLTATLPAAPEVDKIYVGTDALGAKHWDATIKEIIIT